MRSRNVLHLGVKELRGLARDPLLLIFLVFSMTLSVYAGASGLPEVLHRAPIAIVDEDGSRLSQRVTAAFEPPYFLPPALVSPAEADVGLDTGRFTFALHLPPELQDDVLHRAVPDVLVEVDATRMNQAFTGSDNVRSIVDDEVREFVQRNRESLELPVQLTMRARFNQELNQFWFGAIMELINQITLVALVLTGAAVIREREHGTLEHVVVMPVTPLEIMISKVCAIGLVVLVAAVLSLKGVVQGFMRVPIEGSVPLFLVGTVLHLYAVTSLGIFMATRARTMPQFGVLVVLVQLPLQFLSGGYTPRESMPEALQTIMLAAPTTHFVQAAQGILYRGGDLSVAWPSFVWLAVIGTILFVVSLASFRRTLIEG